MGIGGEGIILEQVVQINETDRDCAIRLVPIKKTKNIDKSTELAARISMLDGDEKINPKELAVYSFQHPNIITYLDHSYEFIENTLYHLTSKPIIKSNTVNLW